MARRAWLALLALGLATPGCVTRTHVENAARRSTWPADGARAVAAAHPDVRWPSAAGDILRGTSPAELAAARAAISAPLTQALAKP